MAKINDILNEDWSAHDHGEVEDALKQKLSEMEEGIESAGQVNEIVMNGQHYTPENKVIDLGNVTGTKGDKGDKGDDGASAYEVAVAEGFEGDEAAWLASLKGAKGDKGDTGADGADGADGTDGADGADGKSAYQCYYDTTTDNPKMTEAQWLASLKGADGSQGPKGDKGDTVVIGDEEEFTIVNDLETGGESDALSAEMGKRLALKAGTYAGAWARSKAIIVPFCWLWQEQVGGSAICKPIWHIGNSVFIDSAGGIVSVQAAAIPAAPTFSETSGSTVGKGTELTITPDTDSALYYKIDNGAWIISDVAVTIEITATTTITAKCVNNAGSSSEVACSLTVSGPQAPSFAAAQGTTIASGDVVSRGGSIVVSVPQGGQLHYSTDGTNYTTASGLSVTIPVPAAGVHIYAYNVQDNDQSAVVDHNYTMAALAAPSMSPANNTEFPAGGGTATITATEGDGIRYTTDGSDPRTSNTATVVNALTASVTVSSAMTIKACAFDDYGKSDLVQATYSVETAKLKVTASAPTTMTLTKTDDTTVELTIAQGDNEFAIDTALGGVTTFASCAFGDKTAITKIDFGNITINNIDSLFDGCTGLQECLNLFVNGTATKAFYDCRVLNNLSLGGVITNASRMLEQNGTLYQNRVTDFSRVTALTGIQQLFLKYQGLPDEPIDLSHTVVTPGTNISSAFRCTSKTLIIGSFDVQAGTTITNAFNYSSIKTIKCTTSVPPLMGTDWLPEFKQFAGANAKILVPNASLSAYQSASGWSTYADIMEGY